MRKNIFIVLLMFISSWIFSNSNRLYWDWGSTGLSFIHNDNNINLKVISPGVNYYSQNIPLGISLEPVILFYNFNNENFEVSALETSIMYSFIPLFDKESQHHKFNYTYSYELGPFIDFGLKPLNETYYSTTGIRFSILRSYDRVLVKNIYIDAGYDITTEEVYSSLTFDLLGISFNDLIIGGIVEALVIGCTYF